MNIRWNKRLVKKYMFHRDKHLSGDLNLGKEFENTIETKEGILINNILF